MNNHEDLIRRLEEHFELLRPNYGPTAWILDLPIAATAIKELVADLADARAALRDPDLMRGLFGAAGEQAAQRWTVSHADAIVDAQEKK